MDGPLVQGQPSDLGTDATAAESDWGTENAPPGTEAVPYSEPEPPKSANNTPSEIEKPTPPDLSVVRVIKKADHSAGKLVNLLAKHFPCFRDEARFDGRKVRFLKRAQIFVADLWAALNGTGYGDFHDIGHLTMFAGE